MRASQDVLTMPHDRLGAIRLAGVRRTVVACYENVPFYHDLFDAAGFGPYSAGTLADLSGAPLTTKQELRDNYPYGMCATPRNEVREMHMSSGTTGVATVGGYTEHDLEVWGDC